MTPKDYFIRIWLELKTRYRLCFNITERGNDLNIPSDYNLVFDENFSGDYNLNWFPHMDWGQPYNPSDPKVWFDEDQLFKTYEGMNLSASVKPKYFEAISTTIPNAIGLLMTKNSWKYGIFHFKAKLPSGEWLWPALWFTGRWNWPPEIDMVEAWTEYTNDYKKNRHITTNVHYKGDDGEHKMYGTYWHRMPNEVTKEFIDYDIWWEQDFIKIYYNGYLVLYVTGKEVLDGMFEDMRIIINNSVEEYFEGELSPLVVQEIKVYQKN